MRAPRWTLLLAGIGLAACATPVNNETVSLSSDAFADGGAIPNRYYLRWRGRVSAAELVAGPMRLAPTPWSSATPMRAASSIVWVLTDIRRLNALPEGPRATRWASPGQNHFGLPRLGRAVPAVGQHRYEFRIYALSALDWTIWMAPTTGEYIGTATRWSFRTAAATPTPNNRHGEGARSRVRGLRVWTARRPISADPRIDCRTCATADSRRLAHGASASTTGRSLMPCASAWASRLQPGRSGRRRARAGSRVCVRVVSAPPQRRAVVACHPVRHDPPPECRSASGRR